MPLQLSISLSKKQGLPDYGSIGASCGVVVELDSALLHQDLDKFHQHVKNAYIACSQAINDELDRQQTRDAKASDDHPKSRTASSSQHPATPQASNGNGRGNGSPNGTNGHGPSQKQLDFVNQLARQIRGLGVRRMEALCVRMFDKPLTALSSFEASALIDQLKAIKGGDLDLADVLGDPQRSREPRTNARRSLRRRGT